MTQETVIIKLYTEYKVVDKLNGTVTHFKYFE